MLDTIGAFSLSIMALSVSFIGILFGLNMLEDYKEKRQRRRDYERIERERSKMK